MWESTIQRLASWKSWRHEDGGHAGVVRSHKLLLKMKASSVSPPRSGLAGIMLILPPQNMRELRNNLGQAFGTKKAKKAIASVTENAISSTQGARSDQPVKLDAAAQAMIASMAKDTEGMASRDQLAAEADASKPRPKANLEADVYPGCLHNR